jgi:hypothetical protein
MKTAKICTILAVSLLAAACDRSAQNNTISASESAIPAGAGAAAANDAAANAIAAANPLAPYAGKLPYEAVNGIAFVDRPEVRTAVEGMVADAAVRRLVLSKDVTTRPIELADGRLLAGACEPHNCGPHEWTIAIGVDGSAPEVCYHNDAQAADSSLYYAPGREPETRPGRCTPIR